MAVGMNRLLIRLLRSERAVYLSGFRSPCMSSIRRAFLLGLLVRVSSTLRHGVKSLLAFLPGRGREKLRADLEDVADLLEVCRRHQITTFLTGSIAYQALLSMKRRCPWHGDVDLVVLNLTSECFDAIKDIGWQVQNSRPGILEVWRRGVKVDLFTYSEHDGFVTSDRAERGQLAPGCFRPLSVAMFGREWPVASPAYIRAILPLIEKKRSRALAELTAEMACPKPVAPGPVLETPREPR
jgi:hypothetical protein